VVIPQDQNAGWSHNIKANNKSLEMVELLKYLVTSKFSSGKNQELIEVRRYFLEFSAESFVFEFAIQK
jgi:hypothetical protein